MSARPPPTPRESRFRWRARDASGTLRYGRASSPSQGQLHWALTQQELCEIDIQEMRPWLSLNPDPNPPEFAAWVRQLATLVSAEIPLLQALELSQSHTFSQPMSQLVQQLLEGVRAGKALSQALADLPRALDASFIASVRCAEYSGDLATSLQRAATQVERSLTLNTAIRSALMYPMAVLVIAAAATMAMMVWVIPAFESQFRNWDVPLPAITQVLLWMSRQVLEHFWGLTLSLLALVWLFSRGLDSFESWRRFTQWLSLNTPVLGRFRTQLCVSRFSATLALLHQSGVPILEAVELAGDSAGYDAYTRHARTICAELNNGATLSDALDQTRAFPDLTIHLCRVGERSGQTSLLLGQAAELSDQQCMTQMKGLTTLIEPLMVTFLGLLIGAMVLALYLPIFQLGNLM